MLCTAFAVATLPAFVPSCLWETQHLSTPLLSSLVVCWFMVGRVLVSTSILLLSPIRADVLVALCFFFLFFLFLSVRALPCPRGRVFAVQVLCLLLEFLAQVAALSNVNEMTSEVLSQVKVCIPV